MNLWFYLLVSGVNQGNERGKRVQNFLVLPQGFRSFLTVFLQARWCNLVCVECLQMIKPMVVVFLPLEVDATLGDDVGFGNTYSFRVVKCLQGYPKTTNY